MQVAASCWDFDNCTDYNITALVGKPPSASQLQGTGTTGFQHGEGRWALGTAYNSEMIYLDLYTHHPLPPPCAIHHSVCMVYLTWRGWCVSLADPSPNLQP